MVTLIKWKVFKTAKNAIRARNNLMNIRVWCLAVEHMANKLKESDMGVDYKKQIEDRLIKLEANEVYNIERHR